jgi:hypothetical protein
MSWRKRLILFCGPSILGLVTFGDWLTLLRENGFAVDPPYWLRASMITLGSLGNSLHRRREEANYGSSIRETRVEPPLFVLGIWRSGTTHLQNLLAVDDRFAFPNWYQASFPHSFLSTEARSSRIGGFFVPRERAQDRMPFGFLLPAEDEFALASATARSPLLSWVFPRRAEHYDRYLTFRGVPEAEVVEWKAALLGFVRKLALKHGKPIVLKATPAYRAHPPPPRRIPRGPVHPHPSRPVRRLPIGLPHDPGGAAILHPPTHRHRRGGEDDPAVPGSL